MPALVLYKDQKFKLTWLGLARTGEFKGQRRARIQRIGTHHVEWVNASEIEFIDTPPPVGPSGHRSGKMAQAGKDK